MAQQAKATPEAVFAACATIAARGEAVTLQAVRQEIGGGSLGTIQPLLKAWRTDQDRAARDQAAQDVPATEEVPTVPVRVSQALDGGRQALDAVAGAVADAINTAVADERRRGRLELDTERETWERRLADAQGHARAAEEATDQVAADARAIEMERDDLAERLATATDAGKRLAAELAAEHDARQVAQGLADQHAAEIEALRQTVAQAEARVLAAEKSQEAAERRAVTTEQARDQADADRRHVIEQAEAREGRDAGKIEGLTADLGQVRADLAAAVATAGERAEQIRTLAAELAQGRGELATAQAEAAELRGRLAEKTEK